MRVEMGSIKLMITNVHKAIRHVREAAARLPKVDRWATLLADICQRIVGQIGLPKPKPRSAAKG